MNILITGGAGAIGNCLTKFLIERKHNVISVDKKLQYGMQLGTDTARYQAVCSTIHALNPSDIYFTKSENKRHINIAIHLAAKIWVDEGETCPVDYYENNVSDLITLFNKLRYLKVDQFIFASTSAVYSPDNTNGSTEDSPVCPVSVYGRTKLMGEQIIKDICKQFGIKYTIFRFFNVAGVRDSEDQRHLIPKILLKVVNNEAVSIFGTDYDTPDGTCVRDYIHVNDICRAFEASFRRPEAYDQIFNLGSEKEVSVKDILEAISIYFGDSKKVVVINKERRAGDLPYISCKADKAKKLLFWSANRTITDMIHDTYMSMINKR